MSMLRRTSTDSRRRRILMYQCSREGDRGSSPDRRLAEKLRQARRPVAIYGSSVKRRLRGRWFSLVPVRRRAMAAISVAILSGVLLLCFTHWLAITWQPLAYREPLARAFRLDRPDSFGTWIRSLLLALTAGVALLVYQLRRYRNDDYRGSYRIWPPVIILIGVASLDAVVALVPWGGELIDLMLGKRIAMAGADWIRIGLTVGGAALSLRLVAEVRHSKLAVAMMLVSVAWFALPLAGRWGIFLGDTPLKWWLITSAPLLAAATLCLACTAYLRILFREVRGLDQEDRLADRLQQWKASLFPATAAEPSEVARLAKSTAEKPKPPKASKTPRTTAATIPSKSSDHVSADAAADSSATKPKLKERLIAVLSIGRYFKSRKRAEKASADADAQASLADAESQPPTAASSAPAAKPIAEPVAKPAKPAAKPAREPAVAVGESESKSDAEKPPRRGLGSIFGRWRRSSAADHDTAAAPESAASTPTRAKQAAPPGKSSPAPLAAAARSAPTPAAGTDDEGDGDGEGDDSIDWASMGKAERRRLKRELRRSGDAA